MSRTFPPGPRGKFPLGNLTDFIRTPIPFMMEAASFGELAHFRMGPYHAFAVTGAEYVNEILVKQSDRFPRDPVSRKAAQKFVGNAVVTKDGEPHRRQRKLMQPAFHHKRLESYAERIVELTEQMLADWRNKDQVALEQETAALTMKIVCSTMLNADVSSETDQVGKTMEAFQQVLAIETREIIPIPDWLPIERKRQLREVVGTLRRLVKSIIAERRAGGVDRGDLLSMLLLAVDEETGKGMSDEQIYDELVFLFIAGHETSASALAWAFYLLSLYPDVERTLRQEIDQVLQGRAPTVADLPQLPYLEKVVKETLRLYPSAWIFSRTPAEPVTLGGYQLEKGDLLFLSPFVTQRNPRYFDEPECFKPERFSSEFEKNLPRLAYFPFGAGPHICMGNQFALMEMKLIIATIVGRCRLTRANQDMVQPVGLGTLRPDRPILMRPTAWSTQS